MRSVRVRSTQPRDATCRTALECAWCFRIPRASPRRTCRWCPSRTTRRASKQRSSPRYWRSNTSRPLCHSSASFPSPSQRRGPASARCCTRRPHLLLQQRQVVPAPLLLPPLLLLLLQLPLPLLLPRLRLRASLPSPAACSPPKPSEPPTTKRSASARTSARASRRTARGNTPRCSCPKTTERSSKTS